MKTHTHTETCTHMFIMTSLSLQMSQQLPGPSSPWPPRLRELSPPPHPCPSVCQQLEPPTSKVLHADPPPSCSPSSLRAWIPMQQLFNPKGTSRQFISPSCRHFLELSNWEFILIISVIFLPISSAPWPSCLSAPRAWEAPTLDEPICLFGAAGW